VAEIDVAEQVKAGAVGVARADREKEIDVAIAHKNRDIGTKEAEKERVIQVANLDKESRVGEETASFQRGETRKRVAEADVLKAQYEAQAIAAEAEARKGEAEQRAALEAVARAEKAKMVVDAEAEAEKIRIEAEGQASAIYAKLEAEARGQFEILQKMGQGFAEIVGACGDAQAAFQMLMLEHLDHLSETAAQAISNIKFDKVVVWDGGANGKDGSNATANFLRGLGSTLPPMMHMMKNVGGVEMPKYFGKVVGEEPESDEEGSGEETARG